MSLVNPTIFGKQVRLLWTCYFVRNLVEINYNYIVHDCPET